MSQILRLRACTLYSQMEPLGGRSGISAVVLSVALLIAPLSPSGVEVKCIRTDFFAACLRGWIPLGVVLKDFFVPLFLFRRLSFWRN